MFELVMSPGNWLSAIVAVVAPGFLGLLVGLEIGRTALGAAVGIAAGLAISLLFLRGRTRSKQDGPAYRH